MIECFLRTLPRPFALAALAAAAALPATGPSRAETPTLKIAVSACLSGGYEVGYGKPFLDGIRLAIDEANAEPGGGPRIVLDVQDDLGTEEGAREAASRIVASDALAVVGPVLSISSLAAGPVFAQAGIVSIVSTAESDRLTRNDTTFRSTFKNSDLGESLANYLRHALGGHRAAVIFAENDYGRTMVDGFRRRAEQLGLAGTYLGYETVTQRDEAVREVAADPDKPAVILGMLDSDAVPVLTALRRAGVTAPVLGPTALGGEAFAAKFQDLPEERQEPGFFSNGVYAAVPVILDSANAQTLDFVERLRGRVGGDLGASISWLSVQGYDAAKLAIASVRATADPRGPPASLRARRAAVQAFLSSLDSPAKAMPGLAGAIWFTPDRGRALPIRVGRFNKGLFESAPLQLVAALRPSPLEIASGAVVATGPGQYARRQQVVYTGIFLNEVPRLDVAQSTFTADFYVWIRFARSISSGDADPTQFEFPDLVRGSFDIRQPAEQRDLGDGTTYRLWRLRGDFKNDFDLHRYPADRQKLAIRFFNARAASDRLVYVVDRASLDSGTFGRLAGAGSAATPGGEWASAAFRNLTQWQPVYVGEGRDNLVTASALGDPTLIGAERVRELSGFVFTIEVQRLIGTTMIKTLLPIGLMTLILYATFHFPPALVNAKVTVAITASLSGAVLLSAINTQLGNVGYVIFVEYGFYVFFALCLLCITATLVAEQQRLAGGSGCEAAVERIGRYVFLTIFLGTIVTAWFMLEQ